MGSPELAQYADFYADMTRRFGLTDSLELWRDISERLHQLTPEPEGVTYRDVTANGVPAILVMVGSGIGIGCDSDSDGTTTDNGTLNLTIDGNNVSLTDGPGIFAIARNSTCTLNAKITNNTVAAAYRWLLDQGYDPPRIASTGDSIGGNYSVNLALTLQRKNAPLPGAVLAISPWFDMELKNSTIDTNANTDKMLSRELLRGFTDSMLDGTGIALTDPRINLAQADPTGLPPTMIYYGEYEILVDDANQFAERARAAGVDLELRSLPEGQHNFYLGAGHVPEITAAVAEMGAWLQSKIGLTLATA